MKLIIILLSILLISSLVISIISLINRYYSAHSSPGPPGPPSHCISGKTWSKSGHSPCNNCKTCKTGYYKSNECTIKSDTVCKKIIPSPSPPSPSPPSPSPPSNICENNNSNFNIYTNNVTDIDDFILQYTEKDKDNYSYNTCPYYHVSPLINPLNSIDGSFILKVESKNIMKKPPNRARAEFKNKTMLTLQDVYKYKFTGTFNILDFKDGNQQLNNYYDPIYPSEKAIVLFQIFRTDNPNTGKGKPYIEVFWTKQNINISNQYPIIRIETRSNNDAKQTFQDFYYNDNSFDLNKEFTLNIQLNKSTLNINITTENGNHNENIDAPIVSDSDSDINKKIFYFKTGNYLQIDGSKNKTASATVKYSKLSLTK